MTKKKSKPQERLSTDQRLEQACREAFSGTMSGETLTALVEKHQDRYTLRSHETLAELAAIWRSYLVLAMEEIRILRAVNEDQRIALKVSVPKLSRLAQQPYNASNAAAKKRIEKTKINDEEVEVAVRNYLADPAKARWSIEKQVDEIHDRHLLPDDDPNRLVIKGRTKGTFEVDSETIRKAVLRVRRQLRHEQGRLGKHRR